MKIIGNDGKVYSTVKEAKEADERFDATQKEQAATDKQAMVATTSEKKKLTAQIDAATERYEAAVTKYDELKKESEDIIRDANKKAYAILLEGAKEIEKASNERMNLINEFNTKFNRPFTRFYTGKDAEEQYNKMLAKFSDLFELPFKLF